MTHICIAAFDPVKHDTYTADDAGQFKTMATVDCRGMEIEEWSLMQSEFQAQSTLSSTVFPSVCLDEEFYDYDETGGAQVSITELQTRVQVHKK